MVQIDNVTALGWSARAAAEAGRPDETPVFGIVIRPLRSAIVPPAGEARGGTPARPRG
jgi:hypothetical protein